MDPWSLAAVVGLIFAGKKLSSDEDPAGSRNEKKGSDTASNNLYRNPRDHAVDYMDTHILTPDVGRPIGDIRLKPKNEIGSLQDVAPQLPFGMPVYNLYNRENISNKMNNLNPGGMAKNVGPGLGIGPDVSAAGGFQQFFRVLPNNPNDERLVQLNGNMGGPANPVVKNGGTIIGDATHFPVKTYTRDPIQSRAQGQGGALTGPESRPTHTKTSRPTIRQETGHRIEGDNLEFGPAQYNVYQPYGDMGGAHKLARSTDNRSKYERKGNGQRMNVTADPESRIGVTSNLRRELPTDPMGPAAPVVVQQRYVDAMYYDLNELKAQKNPYTDRLSIGRETLSANPYAISLST